MKYARKHLIEKGELFAPNEENPIGTWQPGKFIYRSDQKRGQSEEEGWKPTYVQVSAMIEVEDSPREAGEGTA